MSMVSPEESSPVSIGLKICNLWVTFSRVLSWEHKHPHKWGRFVQYSSEGSSAGEDVGIGDAPGPSALSGHWK